MVWRERDKKEGDLWYVKVDYVIILWFICVGNVIVVLDL